MLFSCDCCPGHCSGRQCGETGASRTRSFSGWHSLLQLDPCISAMTSGITCATGGRGLLRVLASAPAFGSIHAAGGRGWLEALDVGIMRIWCRPGAAICRIARVLEHRCRHWCCCCCAVAFSLSTNHATEGRSRYQVPLQSVSLPSCGGLAFTSCPSTQPYV